MRKILLVLAGLVTVAAAGGCSTGADRSITVFAGSSAKPVLEEAAEIFREQTGISVYLNIGSSGALLSQMILTKSADIYLSASPEYMERARELGVVFPETEVITNYLVPAILVQQGNPLRITGLSDLGRPGVRVAICAPTTVPAGIYAYEILDFNGYLDEIGRNIVTYSESNEKVSSLVILKSIDAAIAWDIVAGYRPDSLDAVHLRPEEVPRLSYMSGAIASFTPDRESAGLFLAFLLSPEGRAIFRNNGYYLTEAEARAYAPNAEIGGEYRLPEDYEPLVS